MMNEKINEENTINFKPHYSKEMLAKINIKTVDYTTLKSNI